MGTININEREISKKKSNGSPVPLAKASEDVGCRSSDARFFTHFSIFITFGHTLKRLFYQKAILKSINFFNRMMESTEFEAVLSRFPAHRNRHFEFRS